MKPTPSHTGEENPTILVDTVPTKDLHTGLVDNLQKMKEERKPRRSLGHWEGKGVLGFLVRFFFLRIYN